MVKHTPEALLKRFLWRSESYIRLSCEDLNADEVRYYKGQRDMVLEIAEETMEPEEFQRFSSKEESEGMTPEKWRQHINDIKGYSILNEMDYASAWGDGHTVFAIKGSLHLKPKGHRSILEKEMTESELEMLSELPGTPFMAVRPVQ